MATATATEVATVRTSKRKRNQVSYLDDDHFDVLDQVDDEPAFEEQEDPVDEDLDDLSFGTKVRWPLMSLRNLRNALS